MVLAESDTRRRIQAAAITLFTQQGYDQTSLREIADQLGFTKAALYYHFPSKAALARSIIDPLRTEVDALLDAATARGDLAPRALFTELFAVFYAYLDVFTLMIRDASILRTVDLEQWGQEWIERIQLLLVGPEADDAARVRAVFALSGLLRAPYLTLHLPLATVRAVSIDAACAVLTPPTTAKPG